MKRKNAVRRHGPYLVVAIVMLLTVVMLMWTWQAIGQTVIHQTIPGTTVRDYSRPSLVIERDGTGYQTIPGTVVRDYGAPGFTVQGYAPAPVYTPPLRLYQPNGGYNNPSLYNPYAE